MREGESERALPGACGARRVPGRSVPEVPGLLPVPAGQKLKDCPAGSCAPAACRPAGCRSSWSSTSRTWNGAGWRALRGRDLPDVWGDSKDGRWHVSAGETLPDLVAALHERRRGPGRSSWPTTWPIPGWPERWGEGTDPATLERVLFHLLQEYARHIGQLDIVSELADGPVGE